ncbi:MAG: hypothetical protein JF589_12455 [Gemmatimonadetes bacterium]|nr:hypothetical protein [Gemmatimonadota bacterium]
MRATLAMAATVVLLSSVPLRAQSPTLAPDDRIRIAEAFRLADAVGDQIWPAWTSAPFAILLVTPEREFLIRHPRPTPDFTPLGYDSLLQSEVLVRPRQFPPNLLATFPAVGGVPTIVVGQPAATERKNSTEWVVTLLHEHFHQLQTSRPGYYARVDSLGLARGDKTGMWMLNYAFPYDSARVRTRFAAFTQLLDSALSATGDDQRATRWAAARRARAELHDALTSDDDRYLAFQIWQEGVARYTELTIARFAAARYTPSAAFAALPDFVPYATTAERIDSSVRAGLRGNSLERGNRVAFYPAGAAYALMLDRVAPDWRTHYFDRAMSLDTATPSK